MVECDLAKVEVAGSNPVSRSNSVRTELSAPRPTLSPLDVERASVVPDGRAPVRLVDGDDVEA